VTATGNTEMLENNTSTYQFALPTAAASATGTITDSNNAIIWSGPIATSGTGAQTFTWNGENQQGAGQTNGSLYTLTVSAKDSNGNTIAVANSLQGTVTGVQQVNGTTMVSFGTNEELPLSAVTGVSD
jgi:flagellar basal-body rod modification protein FlgD